MTDMGEKRSTRQMEGPGRWFVMLMRTDPFRDLDRLTQQLLGTNARPSAMLMDAWRDGEQFVVEFDLPGVSPDAVDLDVERNVLTVTATVCCGWSSRSRRRPSPGRSPSAPAPVPTRRSPPAATETASSATTTPSRQPSTADPVIETRWGFAGEAHPTGLRNGP